MAKFKKIEGTKGQYMFYCPGCKGYHSVWTADEGHQHPIWGFNGDVEKPTITPSIRVEYPTPEKLNICHSFIKEGMIQFLGDCTHNLAGQTVELPEFDE